MGFVLLSRDTEGKREAREPRTISQLLVSLDLVISDGAAAQIHCYSKFSIGKPTIQRKDFSE